MNFGGPGQGDVCRCRAVIEFVGQYRRDAAPNQGLSQGTALVMVSAIVTVVLIQGLTCRVTRLRASIYLVIAASILLLVFLCWLAVDRLDRHVNRKQ